MKKYYIYLITNVINDKKYVGKSASPQDRWQHQENPRFLGKLQAKLTESQVIEIRNKYSFGKCGFVKLAKEYNVGQTTIRKIISRKTWGHI